MSSTFFNWGDFLRFSRFVMLVKYWFIVLARTDSSEMRLFFSISINLLVFKPFFLKNVFVVFQNFLLTFIFLTLIFSKYSCFIFLKRFTQKFLFYIAIARLRRATFVIDVWTRAVHDSFTQLFCHEEIIVKPLNF